MVVKEDGSKWACQSCLKGHRVSGCTHTDRELILVPKKGRPVTQCQHCRQERKKRSAHVKCECGEGEKPHHSKEKCIHLREAEERAKLGLPDDLHALDKDLAHLTAVADEQGCCCHHGGKCSCALLRKDSSDGSGPHRPANKPRLEKTTSDGAITVFQNGHHKPVHRKNFAAHECGMPYRVPMARNHTDQGISNHARRSVDSLALDSNLSFQASPSNPLADPVYNVERRQSKSEQHSPKYHGVTDTVFGEPVRSPVDLSNLAPSMTNQSVHSTTSDAFSFVGVEPASAVADSTFDPWSAFPSADSVSLPNNNPFGVWPTSNDATSSTQPALTAASSGTQSEIDEAPALEELYPFAMPSIQEDDVDSLPTMMMENQPQSNRHSLPPGFFGNVEFEMGPVNNEWQGTVTRLNSLDRYKAPGSGEGSPMNLTAAWQSSNPPSTSNPARTFASASRPSSRSVGMTRTPNDDLIRQLFPDMDVDNFFDAADSNSPTDMNDIMSKSFPATSMAAPSAAAAPIDFGPFDTGDAGSNYPSQPQHWSDGSLSMPNDPYVTSYDPHDYSTLIYNDWSQ